MMNAFEKTLVGALIAFLPIVSQAQTVKDASDAYNEAYKLYFTDKEATITKLEKALDICRKLGPVGDTIRLKIEGFLPGLYYEVANAAYKEKNYTGAVGILDKAIHVAVEYNSEDYHRSLTKLLGNSYYYIGNDAVTANSLDSALFYYQLSDKVEPRAYKWFSMAQVYLKKNDEEHMTSAIDKTIELGKSETDTVMEAKACNLGRQYYYAQGAALQSKDGVKAMVALDKAVSYEPSYANAYALKALIAYNLKKYQESADAATSAVAYETDPEKLAKIYFKLGFTYVYLKKGPEACAAFKKAAESKTYVNEARRNMQNLHCN